MAPGNGTRTRCLIADFDVELTRIEDTWDVEIRIKDSFAGDDD